MLMSNQMTQLFGGELQETAQQYQDWAEEAHTCSALDLALHDPHAPRAASGSAMLRELQWRGRLLFGGSETATAHAGQLEGALQTAERLAQQLPAAASAHAGSEPSVATPAVDGIDPNARALHTFRDWVRAQQPALFEDYRRRINLALARQQREQLTQLAMLGALEHLFAAALAQLAALPFDTAALPVEQGRCALTPRVQAAFQGCLQQLLEEVMDFNRRSCALSNFPMEATLPQEYEQTILRDIAAAWREFSVEANFLLLDRNRTPVGREVAS
jgi:monoamine oxidase